MINNVKLFLILQCKIHRKIFKTFLFSCTLYTILKFIEKNNVSPKFGEFSEKDIHACLYNIRSIFLNSEFYYFSKYI